jgi:hypothetical protein
LIIILHADGLKSGNGQFPLFSGVTEMNEEEADFFTALESENGGPVRYKTYALLLGISGKENIERGGLLYIIEGNLFFEDFEKPPGLWDFIGNRRKKAYHKFKIQQKTAAVASIESVRTAYVRMALAGEAADEKLPPVTGIWKKLWRTAVQISFKDGGSWFLEVPDDRKLIQMLNEYR